MYILNQQMNYANMSDIFLLCKCVAGSTLYGLNTPSSDLDVRYVFMHTEPRYIVGLDRFEHIDNKNGVDEFGFEIRHYLNLLRKSNTQVCELLHNKNSWLEITPEFKELQDNWRKLVNSDYFYKSLKGYIFGERRLANGSRSGDLGSKRKLALEQFGYSFKNVVQILRLIKTGQIFFNTQEYIVNIKDYDTNFANYLIDIKTNPQNYTWSQLEREIDEEERKFDEAYKNCKFRLTFNTDYANIFLTKLYGKELLKHCTV